MCDRCRIACVSELLLYQIDAIPYAQPCASGLEADRRSTARLRHAQLEAQRAAAATIHRSAGIRDRQYARSRLAGVCLDARGERALRRGPPSAKIATATILDA